MSVFDRSPALRWAVPAGALAVALAVPLVGPMVASADSGLSPRTADELLVDLMQLEPTPLSGTVAVRADLGLPDLPMPMGSEDPTLGLATGESTVRVWYDGPERQRVALLADTSETLLVRNGEVAWAWSSADATADRYEVGPATDRSADGSLADLLADPDRPDAVNVPRTPQEAAGMVLSALDPSTEVSTSGLSDVAGRDVYELVLTPRDPATLVAGVTLSVDAETRVPLRVRIDSTQIGDPAFEVGFTAVDFDRPAADLFTFTPPPGATVTDHGPVGDRSSTQRDQATAGLDEPTVLGEGWSTVVIAQLPADALADLAEQGQREAGDDRRRHSRDEAATALAMLEALPSTSGAWGSGRVLAGTLVSAILTDDGRVAVGAVGPEALGAALAAQ